MLSVSSSSDGDAVSVIMSDGDAVSVITSDDDAISVIMSVSCQMVML